MRRFERGKRNRYSCLECAVYNTARVALHTAGPVSYTHLAIVQWPPGFLRKTEKIVKGKFLKPNKIKKA